MDRTGFLVTSLVVWIGVAGLLYGVVETDVALASSTGLFWAIGVGLTVRHRLMEGRLPWRYTDDWRTVRWTGAFGAVVGIGGLIAVGPGLPVTEELRFGLGLLVLGVAFASFNLGVAVILDATGG